MPDVEVSVYFYTYSTIAQTLAGAFGFLVAVVLFILQGTTSRMHECASTLVANSPADRNKLRQLQGSRKWQELIRLHAEAGQTNPGLSPELNRHMDEQFQELRREAARLVNVRRELARSMYLTATVILSSIASMPLTAFFFQPTSPWAVTLLTVTIVAVMFCIRGYLKVMINVFSG